MQVRSFITGGLLIMAGLVSCKKMDRELAASEKESSISKTRVLSTGPGVDALGESTARIGDTVDITIKLGLPNQEVKLMLGAQELNFINKYSGTDSILDGYRGNKVLAYVPVEHLIVRIPTEFPIGSTNLSLYVGGLRKPAYAFNVVKPMLLFPGKVSVESLFRSTEDTVDLGYTVRYDNPSVRVDGPEGIASSYSVNDIAIDKNTGVIYFLDQFPDGIVLRKKEAGMITTLGGNGSDPEATNIRDKKFKLVNAMKVGPDGKLYLALVDEIPPTEEGALRYDVAVRSHIARLDPQTGELTSLTGANRPGDVFGFRQGLEDGKADTALLGAPLAMDFDREGNLYFIDGMLTYGSAQTLLRVLTKDGMVNTLFGQWTRKSRRVRLSTGVITTVDQYTTDSDGHVDGFAPEGMLGSMTRVAVAGNGKIYIVEGAGGGIFQTNIREINPATREVSTVIGLPIGVTTGIRTGDFKEIDFYTYEITSLDVDYDGNILYSAISSGSAGGLLYKMDLKAETVSLIAGGNQASVRSIYNPPVDGLNSFLRRPQRIVFDNTGKLYVADTYGTAGVMIKGVTIQR